MEAAKYFILFGVLLLVIALTSDFLKRTPITPSIIYLIFGLAIGHQGLNLFPVRIHEDGWIIEILSEITVIVSLFTVGLKLRLPFRDRRWFVPLSLGTISMVITIGIVAVSAHYFLHLNLGEAILLGAILAPTDPVLATEAQLRNASDKDHLRFTLTTEGGLNDGTAFPFIMLGLGILGLHGGSDWSYQNWFLKDFLWAIFAGLAIGAIVGYLVSIIVEKIEDVERPGIYLEDFLSMGSIAFSYGLALWVGSYGFLAVFANAFVIRQIELRKERIKNISTDLPDDVLSFNEQLERIFEVISVVTVGILVDFSRMNLNLIIVALVVFFVARPVAIFIGTLTFKLPLMEKGVLSWAGVRGIGSIYYLFFAINHNGDRNHILLDSTLTVIFLSIVIHGLTVRPLVRRWERT